MGEEADIENEVQAETVASTGRKRDRTLIEFPYTDINRGSELTAALGQTGGKVWIDQAQLAVAMDMSVNGGTFRGRLSAAKMFGFIEMEGAKVRLSDLGILLLDESTSDSALAEAFLRVPLYKKMYESYNGFALPPAVTIERQMLSWGVPPKQTERARQAFASSAQHAGYIASNGRFSKPMLAPAPVRENGDSGNGSERPPPPPPPPPPHADKLEYRLVDLMEEAGNEPEVMKAILTVITFLKTGNGPKKTATDQ